MTSLLLESFDLRRDSASYSFTGLSYEITAHSPEEVIPALREIEAAVGLGLHAAGFVSYEAASGLDSAFPSSPSGPLPLLWFGIFETRTAMAAASAESAAAEGCTTSHWASSVSKEEHEDAVERARERIAAGDIYQVNFTFRRRFRFSGESMALYRRLCWSQQAPFTAFIDLGRFKILSASPELFFRLRNREITVRPMKGTAPRGRWWQEDEAAKEALRENPKERAENLMIVDLLRNDLGIVAETGSVQVTSLFDIETLPTLHQMTSTITATLRRELPLSDLFRALFPCGSITGAPKKRAMEIIKELEIEPRGIYTGCIGYISPAGQAGCCVPAGSDEKGAKGPKEYDAVFSVAIRTALLDSRTGEGELGIGSAITWDSCAGGEFFECLAKGSFAEKVQPAFQLIETLLFDADSGFFLLERHLERLRRSAGYFGFTFDPHTIRSALTTRSRLLTESHKVRLLLSYQGDFSIETELVPVEPPDTIFTASFAAERVDSHNVFLYHKTTNRGLYNHARAVRPDCADVIFVNERGEVTEGTTTTVVVVLDGFPVTPPLSCGLLPGVLREELLEQGAIRERVIMRDELERAEEVYLVNSVRKWRRVKLL